MSAHEVPECSGDPVNAEPRWLNEDERKAWRFFLDSHTLLMNRLDSEMRECSSLSLMEYSVLVRLSEDPERSMRMAPLAGDTGLSRSRLTHTVARLERRGYVERDKSTEDRRGVRCHLTAEGFAQLERTAPSHVESVRTHLIDLLTPEEIEAMAGIFGTVLTHMRQVDGKGATARKQYTESRETA